MTSPDGYASASAIADLARRIVRPPERAPTHAEFASRLVLPDGPKMGQSYRWRDDPAHRAVVEALDAGWPRIVCVGAVQTGKSLCTILVPALVALMGQRQPVVYAQPTKDKLHEAWAGKVVPSLEGAGYGAWLPHRGQGSRGGDTPKFVVFRDPVTNARAGMCYLVPGGGKREGAQAAVTAPVVLVDEVDSFESRHRVELIAKRADSFRSGSRRVFTSTVKLDEGSIILGLYEDSTRGRIWVDCPSCKHPQTLEWENVRYEDDDETAAVESCRYACAGCGDLWDEAARQTALGTSARVVIANKRTRTWGLLWTSLDSTLRDLGGLAAEHWRAARAAGRGDHGPMRSFYRDQLCRVYTADKENDEATPAQISKTYMVARADAGTWALDMTRELHDEDGDSMHVATPPDGAEWMVAAVDVQRGGQRAPGRLYWVLQAWGGDGRTWDVAWGHVVLAPIGQQPNTAQLHSGLSRLDDQLTRLGQDFELPVSRRAVDVGDRQDEIRLWLVRNRDWLPVKGASGGQKATDFQDISGWLYRRSQEGNWYLWLIDTDSVRKQAQDGFLVPAGQPGAAHLPRGIDTRSAIVRHYCSTALIPDGKGGTKWSLREIDRKHHPDLSSRHDFLDCRIYALAIGYKYARELEKKRVSEAVPVEPARDSGWVDDFTPETGGGWLNS